MYILPSTLYNIIYADCGIDNNEPKSGNGALGLLGSQQGICAGNAVGR